MKNKALLIAIVALITLAGCSTQFAYRNMDWLVHWYLDDYVDLNKPQKRLFNKKMDAWLQWHKSEELLAYENHLKQLQQDMTQGEMNQGVWAQHFEQGKQHWVRLRDTLTPDLIELGRQLSQEQVNDLFDELKEQTEERLEEREDYTKKSPAEQEKIRKQDWYDEISQWTGKVTPEQKKIIDQHEAQFQSTFDMSIEYRQRWQDAAKYLLLNQDLPDFELQFERLMTHPEAMRTAEHQARIAKNRQVQNSLFSQLATSLSPEQRIKASKELQELIDNINELRQD